VITVILFFYLGLNSDIVVDLPKVGFEWILIIPYILVIALALFGVNVFSTLLGFSRCHRLYWRIFSFTEFVQKTYEGFTGMTDIFFIVDAYRRFAMVKAGGINYLLPN
jgi:Na+/H+ antiporter NhaC